jgi:hypothetical protein
MKNEEEPLSDSPRGNPSTRWSVADNVETTGSLPRQGRTAAAPDKQPSLSLFSEMMMEAIVDPANMQRVDSASTADVLLETLAARPHAGSESLGARRSPPTGLPPRKES